MPKDYQIITREVLHQALEWMNFPVCQFHSQSAVLYSEGNTAVQQVWLRFSSSELFSHFAIGAADDLLGGFDNADLIAHVQSAFCSDVNVVSVKESVFDGTIDFSLLMIVAQERTV